MSRIDTPATGRKQTERSIEGIVVRSTGSWYEVRTDEGTLSARARGKFRLDDVSLTNPVAVGDRVRLRLDSDQVGLITEIFPRENELSRRAAGRHVGKANVIAANIDFAWVVQAVRFPGLNPGLVDRFIVTAEHSEIPVGIVINKMDLVDDDETRATVDAVHLLYTGLGYPVLLTSAHADTGIDLLRDAMHERTSVLTGPSGVGKSALLNRIDPRLGLKVGEVSESTQKGKHTTTVAALHEIAGGGYVVDTPGIREFGIIDLKPDQLAFHFVEFRPFIQECRYPSCTHDHEPHCGVKAALERGDITEIRYHSYLNILESIRLGAGDVGR